MPFEVPIIRNYWTPQGQPSDMLRLLLHCKRNKMMQNQIYLTVQESRIIPPVSRINKCCKCSNFNPSKSLSPRISQEEGLGRSSSGMLWSGDSPYQPPQPGNQDCRYWIIPELPLLGMDVVGEQGWLLLLGSRTFWKRG